MDAAILIAAARGRSSGAVLAAVRAAVLVTTDRAIAETRRRIDLGLKRPELQPIVDALVAEMTVVPVAALTAFLSEAAVALTTPSPAETAQTTTLICWRSPGASTLTSGPPTATLPALASRAGRRRI